MSKTVVVVPTAPTPATPPSAPSPDDSVSGDLVEVIHDDAMAMGGLIERVNTLETRLETGLAEVRAEMALSNAATVDALETVVETVEEVSDAVTDAPDPVEETPAPEEKDTPPGKSHWLHRSRKEWMGRE